MPTHSSPTARQARRRGFTLLELIVVIVILGVLAALAIPTFARVTGRSQVSATQSTLESIDRDARALAALDDAALSYENFSEATVEVAGAARAVGVDAAGSWTTLEVAVGDPVGTGAGNEEVAVHLTATTATIATLAPTGQVVFVTGPIRGNSSRTVVTDDEREVADPRDIPDSADGEPVEPTPTTEPPASEPTELTAVANPDSYEVNHAVDSANNYIVLINDNAAANASQVDLSTYDIVSAPSHGTASVSQTFPGPLNYVPEAGFIGTDTLTYRWCFLNGSCAQATATFNVIDEEYVPPPGPLPYIDDTFLTQDQMWGSYPGETVVLNLQDLSTYPIGTGPGTIQIVDGFIAPDYSNPDRCELAAEMTCPGFGSGTFDSATGVLTFTWDTEGHHRLWVNFAGAETFQGGDKQLRASWSVNEAYNPANWEEGE